MRRRKQRGSSILAFSHAPPPSCHSLKIFPVSLFLNPWSVSQDYSASPGFSHPLYSLPGSGVGAEGGQRKAPLSAWGFNPPTPSLARGLPSPVSSAEASSFPLPHTHSATIHWMGMTTTAAANTQHQALGKVLISASQKPTSELLSP